MFVVQVLQFSGAVGEETVGFPQLQPVQHGHCRCATTAAGWSRHQKTAKVPQLQYIWRGRPAS